MKESKASFESWERRYKKKLLPGKKVHPNYYSGCPKDSAMSKRFQIKLYYVLLIVFLFLGIPLYVQFWRLS